MCELEGEMRQKEKPKEEIKKDKKEKKKTKKKGKGNKEKTKKINKYSKELTDDEIYSLENFCVKEGKFLFAVALKLALLSTAQLDWLPVLLSFTLLFYIAIIVTNPNANLLAEKLLKKINSLNLQI